MTARDREGATIQVGDTCTYRPDLDSMEDTFGVVPDEYQGDPCTVATIASNTAVLVTFEGDPSRYRVHSAALVKQKQLPAPAPPAPTPTPAAE